MILRNGKEIYFMENDISRKKEEEKKFSLLSNKNRRKLFILYAVGMLFIFAGAVPAFAAGDPIKVVNNLSNFIFGLIRAIGMILLGFGIVQVGLSLKSHDPSQRANGFLTLAGGIIITFAKEILNLIAG